MQSIVCALDTGESRKNDKAISKYNWFDCQATVFMRDSSIDSPLREGKTRRESHRRLACRRSVGGSKGRLALKHKVIICDANYIQIAENLSSNF